MYCIGYSSIILYAVSDCWCTMSGPFMGLLWMPLECYHKWKHTSPLACYCNVCVVLGALVGTVNRPVLGHLVTVKVHYTTALALTRLPSHQWENIWFQER